MTFCNISFTNLTKIEDRLIIIGQTEVFNVLALLGFI